MSIITDERTLLRDEVRMRSLLECVRKGGVIIYPTETIYSIGGALSAKRATETIFELKNRESSNALLSIVFDVRQAEAFTVIRFDLEVDLLSRFGHRGLTLLLDSQSFVASEPRGGGSTLGVRLATTELTRILTERVAEPLTSISASYTNTLFPDREQGDVMPISLADIPPQLIEQVDYTIEAEQPPSGILSTIARVENENRIVILREGVLPVHEIERSGLHIERAEKAG
ncbi:MAG TPA: Sua5/YciO/YrdC/YwlC family protein [Candidatus Kapabacteria bacterium]|nr:Sua5/YciO/YrdC/YwlC family protein [Candidatus Kapabacteria bacterium]